MVEGKLAGKVALVTGGAKNLGGLLSRQLADAGAKVVVHYNSTDTKPDAESTVAAIQKAGGEAFALQGDFTQVADVVKVFETAKAKFGRLDVAINTVGKVLKKPLTEVTEAEYDDMSAVNAKAAFFFNREAGKHLNDGGRICTIVTSLLSAYTGLYSTYAGGKAPVEQYTRTASKEFGPWGISITAVGPGPIDTPFFYGQETPEAVAYHKSASALGGLTDIKDHRPTDSVPRDRRVVDHRADNLRQRWLHYSVADQGSPSDAEPGAAELLFRRPLPHQAMRFPI